MDGHLFKSTRSGSLTLTDQKAWSHGLCLGHHRSKIGWCTARQMVVKRLEPDERAKSEAERIRNPWGARTSNDPRTYVAWNQPYSDDATSADLRRTFAAKLLLARAEIRSNSPHRVVRLAKASLCRWSLGSRQYPFPS